MTAPSPGTVYSIGGKPHLFVRTEQRSGPGGPGHLFIHVDRRVVLEHWTSEVPAEAELIIDAEGRRQAGQEEWLRLAAEHEIKILTGLLTQACSWLPRERAEELRQAWVRTQPPRSASAYGP
jgi:hypothetical protein